MAEAAAGAERIGERVSIDQIKIAIGCFVGVFLGAGFTASFSVFLLPVSETFGWGRSVMSSAFFFAQLIAAVCYPLFGLALDRFGSRRALGPALILHGFSIMALGLINGSIVQLYALYAFLGVGVALTGYLAYVKLISGWFKARRGMVIGLSLGAGVALGGTFAPQVARYLIDTVGWREAYFYLGVPFFVLALPNLFLLKDPPNRATKAERAAQPGMTLGEALRTPTFWILFLAILFVAVGWEGPKGHMVAWLTDRDEDRQLAINVLSLVGLASAAGRILGGFLLDAVQTPRVAIYVFGMVLCGVLILDHAEGQWLLLGAVVLGLGVGAEMDILAYFVSRYFGLRCYGQLYGAIAACAVVSYGLGPMILGIAYDTLGDYRLAMYGMQILIVIAIFMLFALKPYTFDVDNNKAAATSRKS